MEEHLIEQTIELGYLGASSMEDAFCTFFALKAIIKGGNCRIILKLRTFKKPT